MLQVDEETTLEENKTSNKGTSKKTSAKSHSTKKMSYGDLINLLASGQERCQI